MGYGKKFIGVVIMEAWAKMIIVFIFALFVMSIVPYFPIQNNLTVGILTSLVLVAGVSGVYVMLGE